MSTLDTCELFHRCLARRQSDDWRTFVDRHGREVRSMVRQTAVRCRLPLGQADLDEMVQELYCRLLSSPGRRFDGRSESDLWAYLSCVARSLLIDRRRALAARKRRPLDAIPASTYDVPSPKLDPEERLLGKERRQAFLARCLEVTCCERVVVELRALDLAFLGGWTSREIAGHLEPLSVAQVNALVLRLRRRLAKDGIRLPRRICLPSPLPA